MRNYKDSDYALNKFSEGIVYKFADGIVEVTLEAYLKSNPGRTEADFTELKALSDEIYHQQVVQEHRKSRLDVSIDALEDSKHPLMDSFEQELIIKSEKQKALEAAKKLLHSGLLTETQVRRFRLHFFQGLSIRQIAAREGVHKRAVWDSLHWSEKKLKKFFNQ